MFAKNSLINERALSASPALLPHLPRNDFLVNTRCLLAGPPRPPSVLKERNCRGNAGPYRRYLVLWGVTERTERRGTTAARSSLCWDVGAPSGGAGSSAPKAGSAPCTPLLRLRPGCQGRIRLVRGHLADESRVFGNTTPCQVSLCVCQWLGKAGSGLGFVPCSTDSWCRGLISSQGGSQGSGELGAHTSSPARSAHLPSDHTALYVTT